jgi:hypothetical protein
MLAPDRFALLADEAGFGLVETLVAALMGVVLAGALGLTLVVSLHQSARLTDVVEATQLGKSTMTRMVDELHSSCIAPEFKPVLEKSKPNELLFITAYGSEAQLAGAQKHKIVWSGEGGTLTDYSTPSTGGTAPEFTYGGFPAKGTIIGQHISEAGKTPIFQYYEYGTAATSSSTTGLSTLSPITVSESTGLTLKNAEATAAVLITFKAAPPDNNTALARSAEFSNQVIFSFSVPAASTSINVESPCE